MNMLKRSILAGIPLISAFLIAPSLEAADSRLANISGRTKTGKGEHTVIIGFVVGGGNGAKDILIRGLGPGLIPVGVPSSAAVADTSLTLYRGSDVIASNSHWDSSAAVQLAANKVGAYPIAIGSKDSVIFKGLGPGAYTVHLNSAGGVPEGVGLVEVYDASGSLALPRLINISVRARGGEGSDTLIGGFVIDGRSSKKVLVRGVGPALAGFGIAGYMPDPKLVVYDAQGQVVAQNDDWGTNPSVDGEMIQQTMARVGAHGLSAGSKDAAIVLKLHNGGVGPASYTAHVNGIGIALVEIYDADSL